MDSRHYLQGLLAARSRVGPGFSAEAAQPQAGDSEGRPHTDELLHRIDQVVQKMPGDELDNLEDFRRAYQIFLTHAEPTLRRLDTAPAAPLSVNEVLALEAVIKVDGSRPALLIRDDTIDPEHPLATAWRDTFYSVRNSVRKRAAAVGRIGPQNQSALDYSGTGWLVDDQQGIVLTNWHVLRDLLTRHPAAFTATATGFKIQKNAVTIDFCGESGSVVKKRFQLVEATPSGIDGKGLACLDAAVFKLGKSIDGAPLPSAIPVSADLDGPQGTMSSLCLIGFPFRPEQTSGTGNGVNWDWVTGTLFGNRFGLKRLAPGVACRPLGSITGDKQLWVFGHDATTLGGNSGSPLLAWRDADFAGFGLHFGGRTVDTNVAHAIGQCKEPLRKIGVPVAGPR